MQTFVQISKANTQTFISICLAVIRQAAKSTQKSRQTRSKYHVGSGVLKQKMHFRKNLKRLYAHVKHNRAVFLYFSTSCGL